MQQGKGVFQQSGQIAGWFFVIVLWTATLAFAEVSQENSISTRYNQPGLVKLLGYEDSHTIKIPIPKRWSVKKATLRLSYVNSSALLQQRSRLSIVVNQVPIHQVDLVPEAPNGKMTLTLPGHLLNQEYNELTITATQHFTANGCAPGSAPEVWTTLKLYESALDVDYRLNKVPLSLSSIPDFLFDAKMSDVNHVHIVIPDYSPENIEHATLAASGVALRFAYRPVEISLGQEVRQRVDNLLVGPKAFINERLGVYEIPPVADHLGVMHLPRRVKSLKTGVDEYVTHYDSTHALIYLTGDDHQQTKKTVQAFALLSYPLPAMQSTKVTSVQIPEINRYSGNKVLAPEKKYSFKELGWQTTTFTAIKNDSKDLSFHLPSDLLLEPNKVFTLSLNLSYTAAMREDSVLSIKANDHFISSIALSDKNGGLYRGYQLELPLSYLKPGGNRITFQSVLTPLLTGDCEQVQTAHLAMTLFPDSEIGFSKISHWLALPQLRSLFEDGLPLTVAPDFRETVLVLPDMNRQTATAAVNIIAMLSQKRSIAPMELKVARDLPKIKDVELLVVGTLDSIPEEILTASPLFPVIEQPFLGRLSSTIQEKSGWSKFKQSIYPVSEQPEPVVFDVAALGLELAAGPGIFLVNEFESPLRRMRSVVMMSADSQDDLEQGALALWNPVIQSRFVGGAAIVNLQDKRPQVRSYKVGQTYFTGSIGSVSFISYLVNAHLGWALVILALALLLLAGLFTLILKRRMSHKQESIRAEG